MSTTWEIEHTDEFERWWDRLSEEEQERISAAVGFLEEKGPALRRPWVDTVKGSRHSHMKELRPRQGNLRVFFAFDPRRTAILLLGGDKTDRWTELYDELILIVDDLYDDHLRTLQREGAIP